ncbi:MAG: response regulator transcription factor, partial [Sphingobacteriales bacterium]
VLVLGKYDDLKIGSEYIQLGVEAYIPVSRMGEEFMDSIEQLLTKGYVGSYLANQIIKHYTMQASVKDLEVVNHALTVLTRKQLQVLRLRVLHPQMSNQQIADILQVSLNTVEKHITQIISRLEVQGNKGLTQWLADYGVLLFGQWSARYRNLGDS